ncbi:hypothetical protein FXO38_25375 [Capsicum annuum]|nr:hypothetical protein FXO38_25375 [Capsicum annuum]
MGGSIIIGVDYHGQWIEKSNRYVWLWNEGEMIETIAIIVQSNILYDDFMNLIISYCGLNVQLEELIISYMLSFFENQRVLPFKITDQVWLRTYLSDSSRLVLRVYVVKKTSENENQNIKEKQQQDIFDDRLDDLDMNIPNDDQTPTLVDATNMVGSYSRLTQYGNRQDEEIVFYKGMSFMDKK